MYEIEVRRTISIPNDERCKAKEAAALPNTVKTGLSELGFKSQDVVKINNYHFRLAEIQRATAFCECFSATGAIFCD